MKVRVALLIAVAALFAGCKDDTSSAPQPKTEATAQPAARPATSAPSTSGAKTPATAPAKTGLANPASVNCGKVGGKTVIRKDAKGGEVGYCVFANGSECEEWDLLRGKCWEGKHRPHPPDEPKRDPFTKP